jgi:hypothetical protein
MTKTSSLHISELDFLKGTSRTSNNNWAEQPKGKSICVTTLTSAIFLYPVKGKRYVVKITSEKLSNGRVDKLYNTGRYVARFNGKHFLIGSLKRQRSVNKVSIVGLVNSGR